MSEILVANNQTSRISTKNLVLNFGISEAGIEQVRNGSEKICMK